MERLWHQTSATNVFFVCSPPKTIKVSVLDYTETHEARKESYYSLKFRAGDARKPFKYDTGSDVQSQSISISRLGY